VGGWGGFVGGVGGGWWVGAIKVRLRRSVVTSNSLRPGVGWGESISTNARKGSALVRAGEGEKTIRSNHLQRGEELQTVGEKPRGEVNFSKSLERNQGSWISLVRETFFQEVKKGKMPGGKEN